MKLNKDHQEIRSNRIKFWSLQKRDPVYLFIQKFLILFTILFSFAINVLFAQNGLIWSPAVDIAPNMYSNQHPRITSDANGNPMVIWGKFSTNTAYFSRWDDSTNSFITPINLNPVSQPLFTASWAGPDIASHGDTVYAVYKVTPEDTGHIFIVRSFDGGRNFSSPIQADLLVDSISRFPTITTDSVGNPIVAYMKFELGFLNADYVVCRSNDFGSTFLMDHLASGYTGAHVCDCCPAAIISSGNKAAMLYRDNFNDFRTIWAGISNDNCTSFPFGMSVDHTSWYINACPSTGPDGIIIGDSLYTVFMSGASGDARCYMSKASISSFSAGPDIPLTDSISGLTDQNYPRISNYGNKAAVVCKQMLNGNGMLPLFYTQDISAGLSQSFDTAAVGSIINADVLVTSDAIHIVWQDDNSETVKYRKATFNTTGVSSQIYQKNQFSIYPSPAKDYFIVKSKNQLLPEKIEMFDISGRKIAISSVTQLGQITCHFSDINPGIYNVIIIDQNQNRFYNKLVIE